MKQEVQNMKEMVKEQSTEKLNEIITTMHNAINHRIYYSNPKVWMDMADGDNKEFLDYANVEYAVCIGAHLYRYCAIAENENGNVVFTHSFYIEDVEATEFDFINLLLNAEEELGKRNGKEGF